MDSNGDNARYGFITYKNYLTALSHLINVMYSDYSELTKSLKSVSLRENSDKERIKGLLMNSWNSEMLLNFPELLHDGFLKFSNHWAPVQSYYSIYLALRALIVAKGISARGDHSTTLQVVVSNFISTEKLFPAPWNIIFNIDDSYINLPNNINPSNINPLENPHNFKDDKQKLTDSFCLFLKTTHSRLVDEKCDEWKVKNPTKKGPRRRLPRGFREAESKKHRAISIFDCYYRLRIRSNYKDVDIFILGSSTPETTYYFDAIRKITDKTLFLIENYLFRYLGKKIFDEIINDYKKTDSLNINSNLSFGVLKRSVFYA